MSTFSAAMLSILIPTILGLAVAAHVIWRQRDDLSETRESLQNTLAALRDTRSDLQQATTDAYTDDLTGLPNRRRLLQQLHDALRDEAAVAVAFLDLDGFKTVNDTYGHGVGDDVLREVAARLQRLPAAVCVTARLTGDEFVLIIFGNRGQVWHAADTAWRAVTAPICVGTTFVTVGASIGLIPDGHGVSAEKLLGHADHAMYQAKAAGGGIIAHRLRPTDT